MATTAQGTTYVESADLVSAYPTASLAVANAIDAKASLAMTQNAQTGTSYTAALTDGYKLVTMSNASANTFEVPPQGSVTWVAGQQLRVLNIGAGTCTITPGSGVTINGSPLALGAHKGGTLIRTASDVWTFVPFSSGSAGPTVSGTTGSPSTSTVTADGVSGTLYDFGSNGSITTTAGRARVLIIGGGSDDSGPNYGNAGTVFAGWIDFTAATHTVTVGARGTSASAGGYSAIGSLAGANGGLKPTNPANGIGAGLWLGVADYAGYPDTITGSSVTYAGAQGSTLTTYGSSKSGTGGIAGRVFIFIPS